MESAAITVPDRADLREQVPEVPSAARWSIWTRIAFRFACSYFLLYCFPTPIDDVATYVPLLSWVTPPFDWYENLWTPIVMWLGPHVFHVNLASTDFVSGSGDRVFDWVTLAAMLGFAFVATAIWSIVDRKGRYDERIYPWFRWYIRAVLAMTMLYYGSAKIFPSQFYPIPLSRYMQPLAAGSPMGLLWSMMSASRIYAFFAGFVEASAAALLFVPRLATLGALVAAGALTNIVLLNFGLDVPVKLYSLHLLVIAVLIAGPDLRNLFNLFVLKRSVTLTTQPRLFRREWLNRTGLITQLLAGIILIPAALFHLHARAIAKNTDPAYYGLWSVDNFRMEGKLHAPLLTDPVRWRSVGFDHDHRFYIQPMDGTPAIYNWSIDSKDSTVILKASDWNAIPASKATLGTFKIRLLSPQHIALDGALRGKRIDATLHNVPLSSFLLVNRGFHWVNDEPFNI